jgi:spore germination protein YaaH
VTLPRSRPYRTPCRALLALALGTLLATPFGLAPPASARTLDRAPSSATADGPGGDAASASEPSVHYRQAEEHAADTIDFEPGTLVSIPFRPRSDDPWEVDGVAPQALPGGFATGAQMRAATTGMDWAAGVPRDVAAPWHFGVPADASSDPGVHSDAPAGPGGATLTRAVLGPDVESVDGAPVGSNGLRREVFGFLPYWVVGNDTTVLDWRTLSTVAYFSVGCTSNGSLWKRNADGSATTGWAGWTSSRMTSVINAAHAHQTRVVLTVSCFAWSTGGAATQAALLGSSGARSMLARQVAAAVRDRGADGVNLDFEPIVDGYSDEFTKLVRAIRAELNAVARGYQLTFDAMGSIGNQPIAEATAPGGADAVLIMGYDYRTASSPNAGSIAPLSGPVYDLTDTIRAFTAEVAPSKLILGVPWYGRAWSTTTNDPHARNISGTKYGDVAEPTYAQAAELLAAYGRRWDAVEQSPWTAYRKVTCSAAYSCVSSWRELYFDDAASLKLRYDLINRASLRGAGIWALGFDNTRGELRNALAEKFLADRTPPLAGIVSLPQRQRDEGFRVAWTSWDDSAVRGYDVQVSINGGGWAMWLAGTTATSAIYLGTSGRTYAFRIRATDTHGNASAWRSLPLGSLRAPASIAVGGFATVVTDGLRLRASPSTGAAVMTTFSHGDALRVIGGPATAQGYTWYQVEGPVRQWGPVDTMQVGGWVAASGNGVTNAAPRSPTYATRVDAGITGMRLNDGGSRVLTPNGDGANDRLLVEWTNHRAFDSLALRVFRTDGTLAGSVDLGATRRTAGPHGFNWDGRIGGSRVPSGAYVLQVQGVDGGTTYSAASASPVSPAQIARWGIVVGNAAPTSVRSLTSSTASPTRGRNVTYTLTFGGPVQYLTASDFSRSGTAAGCSLGRSTGSGATWSLTVTGCGPGTLVVSLRAGAVMDAVGNWGPTRRVASRTLVIDRTVPTTSEPKVAIRTDVSLGSTSPSTAVLATLAWSAKDVGGAGLASHDVRRSADGGAFADVATGLAGASLAISLAPGHAYRFAVRARDRAGNVGAWTAGPTLRASLVQQSSPAITYVGTWRVGESSHYSAMHDRFATSGGAAAKYTFTGRGIAWVTTRGPDRGAVKVYLDGMLVATVDTRASALAFRYVAWSRTWASSGTHRLTLVAVGTTGRSRIDLDAIEVLR